MVGDLSLVRGEWPILGTAPNWVRADWPMPDFVRVEDLTDPPRRWRVSYDDTDPNRVLRETPASEADLGLERDSLHGSGATEIALDLLIEL